MEFLSHDVDGAGFPKNAPPVKNKRRGHPGILLLSGCILISLAPRPFGRQPGTQEQADSSRLAAILKKTGEYCQRLDRAALDFICLEDVTEMTRSLTPHTDHYIYDYQFIRKNEETREKRNLVEVNGKKAAVKDSPLNTVAFQYKNVLFGPVGLLSHDWQAYYDYRLAGEEIFNNKKAVVIEATPNAFLTTPHPYGKIWINEEGGSVLKIVWDQKSLGNFQSAREWAEIHDAEPQITAFSEYGIEKNGLRFPSRSYTENAFIDKDKRVTINSSMLIIYRDYKFFTVETEVKYD
jgi:hypothetical protein